MNPLIAQLQAQALRTSFIAESVAARVTSDTRREWISTKTTSLSDATDRHSRRAGANMKLAAVGLIGATGIAIAGGPSSLGVAAFVASAASTGGAIFHLAAGKLAELRLALESRESQARPLTEPERLDLLAHAHKLSLDVWDETMSELREDAFQSQANAASTTSSKPASR